MAYSSLSSNNTEMGLLSMNCEPPRVTSSSRLRVFLHFVDSMCGPRLPSLIFVVETCCYVRGHERSVFDRNRQFPFQVTCIVSQAVRVTRALSRKWPFHALIESLQLKVVIANIELANSIPMR